MKNLFIFAVMMAIPELGSAQTIDALRAGARIEVTTTHGESAKGLLRSLSNDSLKFRRNEPYAIPTVVALDDIKSIRVSSGRHHRRGALNGGIRAGLVGAIGGALLGSLTYDSGNCVFGCTLGEQTLAAVGIFGGTGFVFGTILGFIGGKETWESVDLPGNRASSAAPHTNK